MTIFSEFLIIGFRDDDLKETEILNYYGQAQIPDYLRNINIMCFTQSFDVKNEIEVQKKIDDINSKNYMHQFVITDKNGKLRFCTSLIVYERYNTDLYLPYAYVIVSEWSNLVQQKSYMRAIYNGIFDRVTRYRDRGWQLGGQKLANQQLLEFYLSVGISNLNGLYFVPKQIMRTRQEVITDLIITNPQLKGNLYNQDICFKTLLSRLSYNSIIKIVQAMILEKQIILFTTQIWDLPNITEALLQFIYPLKWRCIYIPYLPAQMLDTLHASVPYIIGVHNNLKEKVLTQFDCLDKVLVDLDQDRVIGSNLILAFPEQLVETLCNQTTKFALHDDSELLQLQGCFLKFHLQLINNILPYFIYSESQQQRLEDMFDKDLYIEQFTPIDQEFYREFANKTMVFRIVMQMFPRFIEESYRYLYQKEFLKQNAKPNLFVDLLILIKSSGYFNLYKAQSKEFEAKLFTLINEQCQLKMEQEISIHSLFPQYLKQINDSELTQRKFPVVSIERDKIVHLECIQHSMQQNTLLQRSTHSIFSDVCSENKQQINILTLKAHKIHHLIKYQIQNDVSAHIVVRYPKKSLAKLKKTLADQLLQLPDTKPTTSSQLLSVRQSRRIFNNPDSGYVSMYRTKTHNIF